MIKVLEENLDKGFIIFKNSADQNGKLVFCNT